MSSLCAVIMAGGTLSIFAEDVEEIERQLGVSAAIACGGYCLFYSDAACGYATTSLLGYMAEMGVAEASKNRFCS